MRPLPVTRALEDAAGDCRYCPKMCRFACPVAEAEASEAATPAFKGGLAHAWMRGEAPLAGAVAEAAYRCADCLLAREACLWEHEPPEQYAVVRAAALAAGVAPARAVSYVERVRRLGNPFEADLAARLVSGLLATEAAAALLPDGARADVVLFPGCAAARHDLGLVREARAVVERVERAPLPVAASGAGCCGYPLFAAGDLDGARSLAERTAAALAGAREVLVLDPGCAQAMTRDFARVGVRLGARVRTVVERLGERLDAVRAAVRDPLEDEAVAYHDPCLLGRGRGVYDAPRALLAAACGGRAPLELATRREGAWCSGAGGCYSKLHPEGAARIRERRLDEHRESGAARLATACPSARRFFERGLRDGEARPLDVVSIVARALGVGS